MSDDSTLGIRGGSDRLWRSAAVSGLHPPLMVFYAVTVIVLFTLSIVLMPIFLLGVPLLAATFAVVRIYAAAERGRCGLLGVSVQTPKRRPGGWRQGLLRDLRSLRTWRQLLYFVLILPLLGLVGYVLPFTLAGLGVASLVAPFVALPTHPVIDAGLHKVGWAWWPIAVLALALACWLVCKLADGWSVVVGVMLGRGVEEELVEQVETLTVTRRELVAAADAERARIERDLHDGAQQRLSSLAINLGIARAKLHSDPDAVGAYVIEAHKEAKAAMVELRDLARGIYPVLLADRGLDAVLSAVAARSPIPVELDIQVDPRPPRSVEVVAYFVVTEALTNVARHSGATAAVVRTRRDGSRLSVSVMDDGHGGADEGSGTGLAGLAHRVRGAAGTMTVTSPVGGPTTIAVELPCES